MAQLSVEVGSMTNDIGELAGAASRAADSCLAAARRHERKGRLAKAEQFKRAAKLWDEEASELRAAYEAKGDVVLDEG